MPVMFFGDLRSGFERTEVSGSVYGAFDTEGTVAVGVVILRGGWLVSRLLAGIRLC